MRRVRDTITIRDSISPKLTPMNKFLFAALAAAATLPSAAFANQSAYLGLAVGAGKADLHLTDGTSSLSSNNNPVPLNGYIGYNFRPNIAVEAGITFFGEYTFNGAPTALFGVFHAAIKGTYPLNDKLLLTGKVGLARHGLSVDVPDGSRTTTYNFKTVRPLFAVGMEYRFTDRVSGTVALNDYGTSKRPEATMQVRNLEAGIQYRF